MRYLQRKADVDTRYGGRFVNSIEGISSSKTSARRRDWFYYVNGIEADKGAAEWELHPGDRVWWDYRDWTAAMRVPTVVGSFPEPFVHGAEGKRFPVRVDCADGFDASCERLIDKLDRARITAGKTALGAASGKEVLRFVVGNWDAIRVDAAAKQLEEGPAGSGVYARPVEASGNYRLELLDPTGDVAATLGPASGLVAAARFEEQQPTWIVSGTDRAGVERAIRLIEEPILRDRYALATDGRAIPLPVRPKGS
jgi:hypothetical protein